MQHARSQIYLFYLLYTFLSLVYKHRQSGYIYCLQFATQRMNVILIHRAEQAQVLNMNYDTRERAASVSRERWSVGVGFEVLLDRVSSIQWIDLIQ